MLPEMADHHELALPLLEKDGGGTGLSPKD